MGLLPRAGRRPLPNRPPVGEGEAATSPTGMLELVRPLEAARWAPLRVRGARGFVGRTLLRQTSR